MSVKGPQGIAYENLVRLKDKLKNEWNRGRHNCQADITVEEMLWVVTELLKSKDVPIADSVTAAIQRLERLESKE
jgi:hypothetical protein